MQFSFCLRLTAVLLFASVYMQAQNVLYSPVFGAATQNSVTILFFTRQPCNYVVELSTDSFYRDPKRYFGRTDDDLHNRAALELLGLEPSTNYYYRILINDVPDARHGHIKTFPPVHSKQHLVIGTGSCQETADMEIFNVIAKHKPDVFIHTGDWTYPDYMVPGYPRNDSFVFKGWERRYTEKVMADALLPYTMMDYMADNHDGIGGSAHNHQHAAYKQIDKKKVVNYFVMDTILPSTRRRVIKAYADYFPTYPLEDTTIGIYHSFYMGNCEFFVLDIREDSKTQPDAFKYDSATNHWSFVPDKEHTIIGPKQMAWLKKGLLESKADWKFLVMGVPFNKNLIHLINLGIHFQDLLISAGGETGTGFRLAASWSYYWPGYPQSQYDLLKFIKDNNLKDIIVLSGDTHHNVMDDGTNGGLPEINASGLSITGAVLAHYMDLIGRVAGYPKMKKYLWNGGGNGIGNKNYKNAYGQVDVYGSDSVRLSLIDETDHVISEIKIPHSSIAPAAKPYHKPAYIKRVERISYSKKPTARIKLVKALARAFYHKKKKLKGDVTMLNNNLTPLQFNHSTPAAFWQTNDLTGQLPHS